jgi:GNAT superfamily N-acetyltransferase
MKLIIRAATPNDIPAIHRLVSELAEYEKSLAEFVATLDEYHHDFKESRFHAQVAENDAEIIGMALYYPAYSTWKGKMLYLEDFVVTPAWRGKGVGKKLMDAFLNEAKQMGCVMVKWQVLDWNEPAVKFYENLGAFVEKGWWNVKMKI